MNKHTRQQPTQPRQVHPRGTKDFSHGIVSVGQSIGTEYALNYSALFGVSRCTADTDSAVSDHFPSNRDGNDAPEPMCARRGTNCAVKT